MDSQMLLSSIGEIDDQYILSAQKKLGLLPLEKVPECAAKRPFSRVWIALLASILILLGTFTAAVAVSPEFREAVFAFLGITQTEVVPYYDETTQLNPDSISVEPGRADIGGLIQGTYVHTPAASLARNGLFAICTDEVMMNSGNHFDAYIEENGRFIQLEERTFRQDYTILGNEFHVEFQWVEHNGSCSCTYAAADVPYLKLNLAGGVNATLFTFSCKISEEGENGLYTDYPVLIDLETGELTDVLKGTGAETLPGISNAAISEDLSKMLLVQHTGDLYYADLSAHRLYAVEELSGERPDACSLIGDTLACWVLENASSGVEHVDLGTYRAWTIDLSTFEKREIFSGVPATASTSYDVWSLTYNQAPYIWAQLGGQELPPLEKAGLIFINGFSRTFNWGNMYLGSQFALELDEYRHVYVIDLATGVKTRIEGYLWPDLEYPAVQTSASPDGTKLLVYTKEASCYFDSVGILDFAKTSYIQFSRENLNDVNEHTIYWFDNGNIIIGTNSEGPTCDYYIYSLPD